MHDVALALSIGLVLLGIVWLLAIAGRRKGLRVSVRVLPLPRPRLQARQLGLAHRFAGRLLRSSRRVADADFQVLEAYTSAVDIRPITMTSPAWSWVSSAAAVAEPLLELEKLVEALEKFSARVRSWRPGRRRERS
jgi:hypothetical protein